MNSKIDPGGLNAASRLSGPRAALVLVFALALMATLWRFLPWIPHAFFGDDLYNYLAYKDGFFPEGVAQALTTAFAEKYRPVFVWALSFLFGTFGDRVLPYMAVNMLLHALNATLVFAIARRLGNGQWLVPLVIAVAVATSRFALYQVTQITGLLEGVALMLFLCMTYCVVRASEAGIASAGRWLWLAVAAAFLVIHTHERYVVVAVWLGCALVLLPSLRALPRARWLALLFGCGALILFNLLFKTQVLRMPFFVGTGDTHLEFDLLRVVEHLRQAALSIFGFNEGPGYLVGARTAWEKVSPAWVLAAAFSLIWLLAFASAVRATVHDKGAVGTAPPRPAATWPLLLLGLAGMLLVPPLVTIRIEQRWLFEPFILVLLVFAWACGTRRHPASPPTWILALGIGLTSLASDSLIARSFGEIFFVSGGQFAKVAKRDIADKDPGRSTPVALIANADNCNWTLLKGGFFRLYGGTRRTVVCFDSMDEIQKFEFESGTRIYGVASSPLRLMDVTDEATGMLTPIGSVVTTDFLALFPQGRINDATKVDSPSGRGAMMLAPESMLGRQETLTLISGFSYRYDDVSVKPGAVLRFGITMLHPTAESARATVRVDEPGAPPHILYSEELVPPRAGEKLRFKQVAIPLEALAAKNVSFTFGLETAPGKDQTGHWAAFSAPRITVGAAR